MIDITLKRLLSCVGFLLLQILLLNNIKFLGFITPYLYVYFILLLPSSVSKEMTLVWGFLLGLVLDIFCDTLGCNAFATTFVAFLKPYFQNFFGPKDDFDDMKPSIERFGFNMFVQYVAYLVLIHHLTFFLIEAFTLSVLWFALLKAVCCSVFTLLLILSFEYFKARRR